MRWGSYGWAPLVVLAVTALTAGPAHATTAVEESGPRLRVAADAGRVNDISVGRTVAGAFQVSDNGDRVVPGAGCAAVNLNAVQCQWAGITRIGVDAGDLDDRVVASGVLPDVFLAGG